MTSRNGARAWTANRPNLLTVAVSRARRWLYVIGDREAWMHHRYFDLLGAFLDGYRRAEDRAGAGRQRGADHFARPLGLMQNRP